MIEQAKWIACGTGPEVPIIVKNFMLNEKAEKAVIEITGLGFFQLYVNGERVSDDLLVPCISDYAPREFQNLLYPIHDTFHHRVYYLRYDIKKHLKVGKNELQIMLGDGWYRQTERNIEGNMDFGGRLLALFAASIQTANETVRVMSDGSERYYASHIIYSQLFIGEVQDSRLLRGPKVYYPVKVVDAPCEELTLQECPADRVTRTVMPDVAATLEDRVVYDVGENVSGIPVVYANGPAGAVIRIQYGEELNPDGSINFDSTGSSYKCTSGRQQIQEDVFICNGTPMVFTTRFVWHAFRYFSVEGKNCEVLISEVHSNIGRSSTFHSRSEGLNYLYTTYMQTQLANMHCGIPSDCPHRERLGYTGDGQVTCETAMLLLDSKQFYRKWLRDIADGQDPVSGHVQHTAPFMGGGGGPAGWGGAIIEVTYRYWRQYGEREAIEDMYPRMMKFVDYMQKHSEDYLVVREEEGGWCLGDWASLGSWETQATNPELPEPFVNSCLFTHQLTHLCGMAEVLGHEKEAEKLADYAEKIRESIVRHFFDDATGNFCGGIKGANAFAIGAGIDGDPRVRENLIAFYTEHKYIDCGFLGSDKLIDVLFQLGEADLAYSLIESHEKGSFLYMKDHGASTFWEYLDGRHGGSLNHPMFGAPARCVFRHILGIRQNRGSCGYTSVYIEPKIPKDLESASGSINTPQGPISVSWRVENGNKLICHMTVPQSSHAVFKYKDYQRKLHGGDNRLELPY